MQNVSRKWRLLQQEGIIEYANRSYIEIYMDLSDPDAIEDAQAQDSGSMHFSNTSQIVDGLDKSFNRYAMLEHNQWRLDGSFNILPDLSWGDTGFVGDGISDEYGGFANTPIVTLDFTDIHENLIPGLTITWSETLGEFARDFNVIAFASGVEVARTEVVGNFRTESIVYSDVINYDRIDIEVVRWCLPQRRARIESIFIGIKRVWKNKDLFHFEQSQICDPLAAVLPKYSVKFEINNVENEFDPNNPAGLTKYLMDRQRVAVRYGYKFDGVMEWISGGVYFLSNSNAPQNGINAVFEARDLLLFMQRMYTRGVYQPNGVSLHDLAEEVLLDANIPPRSDGSPNWFISDSLRDIFTTAPLPIATHANCLKFIANAACVAIFFDRDGVLYLSELPAFSFVGHSAVSDNGSAEFSNTEQIVDGLEKEFETYATAEHNIWSLDRSLGLLSSENTGFVSDILCDENGYFETSPIITLSFDRLHTSPVDTIQIIWSTAFAEFAIEFIVTAYNSNAVVAQVHVVDNNNVTAEVDIPLVNYDRITIEVVKWCIPHRRARIEEIPSGFVYQITNQNSFARAEMDIVRPIGGTEVRVFDYFVTDDRPTLYDGIFIINGTRTETVTYSQPATNVSATVTGGTLISAVYYTYSCELTISGSGNVNVLIVGNQLNIAESTVVANNDADGEFLPVSNRLITSTEMATAVAQWSLNYLISRIILSPKWRADPRLDVLDIASIENRFGRRFARMTEVKYVYNGAFLGTGKGRVYIE